MRVSDVMVRNVVAVRDSYPLARTREVMREYSMRAVPVLGSDDRVLGMVTAADVMLVPSTKTNMLTRGVMSPTLINIEESRDLFSAARELISSDVKQAPVLDKDRKLRGLLTAADIVAAMVRANYTPKMRKIGSIMNRKFPACSPSDPISSIMASMTKKKISVLPVVKDGKPLGMLSIEDAAKKGRGNEKVGKLMMDGVKSVKADDDVKTVAALVAKEGHGKVPVVDDDGKMIGVVDRFDVLRAYVVG